LEKIYTKEALENLHSRLHSNQRFE